MLPPRIYIHTKKTRAKNTQLITYKLNLLNKLRNVCINIYKYLITWTTNMDVLSMWMIKGTSWVKATNLNKIIPPWSFFRSTSRTCRTQKSSSAKRAPGSRRNASWRVDRVWGLRWTSGTPWRASSVWNPPVPGTSCLWAGSSGCGRRISPEGYRSRRRNRIWKAEPGRRAWWWTLFPARRWLLLLQLPLWCTCSILSLRWLDFGERSLLFFARFVCCCQFLAQLWWCKTATVEIRMRLSCWKILFYENDI